MNSDDVDALIASTPATDDEDLDKLIASTPAQAEESRLVTPKVAAMSRPDQGMGHAATFGALDWLPNGKQAAALATALRMKLSGSPIDFGENYRQALGEFDRENTAATAQHPIPHGAGAAAGLAGGMLVPGGAAAQGALYGLSGSGADEALARGDYTEAAKRAALGTGGGAVAGKVLELGGKTVSKPIAKFLEDKLGPGVRNVAGSLKWKSLRANPKVTEAVEALPGGTPAAGLELLDRNVGGLTKRGTAKQVAKALDEAGAKTSDLASSYDAAGGAPIDLSHPLDYAMEHAGEMNADPIPTTKAAGDKLADLVESVQESHGDQPASAVEALGLKRKLGREAYGANDVLKRTGDLVHGDYGEGVMKLERGVDSALDKALGPEFEGANLSYRRLLGANQAAERTAARAEGNHLGPGLLAMEAAHLAGAPATVAWWLGGKYGAQAGAKALHSAPKLLQTLTSNPGAMGRFAPALQQAFRDRGEQGVAALHHVLAERYPEYRARTQEIQEEASR